MDKKAHLTQQRQAVYDVVQASTDHPTASDVIERLRESDQKVSYATVYNSLRYLSDAGLIHELKIGETVSRYDGRTEAHYHIVCQKCGRVDELVTPLSQSYFEAVSKNTNYVVEEIDLIAKGVCCSCQAHGADG